MGTQERFQPLAGGLCYLLLPDGGKVEFAATSTKWTDGEARPPVIYYSYSFTARALIDPYGLRTTFTADPSGYSQITEPAGRWIRIFSNAAGQVTHVDGSDGRSVVYNYTTAPVPGATIAYTLLTSVRYFNDATLDATYTYAAPNVGSVNGMPLLKTCVDSMYAGPMKKIGYVYQIANNPDGTPAVYGQILSENYYDGGNPATLGAAVSTLAMNDAATRTETRGDGFSRTFVYGNGLLQSSTDFKGVSASQTYDSSGYLNSSTDRRGQTTNYVRDPITGNVTLTTFPLTPLDGGVRSTASVVYGSASCPDPNNRDGNNPYYVYSTTNERGYTIIYSRDANKRVIRIDYPNTAYETFSYAGSAFGLVTSHRMTNGYTETLEYDASGQRTADRSPLHQSGNPTTRYTYDGLGRIWRITDALGTSSGDPNRSTVYAYNSRGQVTGITHPDNTYLQYAYNPDGTLAWTADENHPGAATDPNQRTRYVYDDYKRVTSVTNPLNQTASSVYAQDWVNPYQQTTANPKAVFSPLSKAVHYAYDGNWERTIMRQPTAEVDAFTWYDYDAAGNLTWQKDPRENVRTFAYDERNRLTSATDPAPFNSQITRWEYDRAGNLTKTTRPDNLSATTQYDAMNRATQTAGFASEPGGYVYDLSGNLTQMSDAKGAVYAFGYDAVNRKTSATYPADAYNAVRSEVFGYDSVGNLVTSQTPVGWVKTTIYDNRNRPTSASWNTTYGGTVGTTMTYDAASRVTSVVRGPATVAFGYDNANREIWEDQTLSGYPTRRVETPVNADGQRTRLLVATPYVYDLYYDYTGRGQLKGINDNASSPWLRFTYDPSGNLTKRQGVYGGLNDSTNVAYDQLNRPTTWEQTGAGDVWFAREHLQYDALGRLNARWRDEQASQGESYGYDMMGQLISARYNANGVASGTPTGGTLTTYNVDALNRTGINGVNANGVATAYTPNALNQYTNVGGQSVTYDGNFHLYQYNGWTNLFDADRRLTSTTGPSGQSAQFVYDGLGRCVKRTLNGVTTLFTYDGWKPMLEWDAAGNFAAWNVYGAGPDEILWRYTAATGQMRYHLDRQGNVAFLFDLNGVGREKYTYEAFGQPTVTNWDGTGARSTSNYGNRFMFTGREWLAPLGIYDYRNRMYQPQLGRFLQTDPLGFAGGDANLFRYCGGDPVNRSDPSGLVEVTKKVDGNTDPNQPSTATTDRVTVNGGPDFGGTNTPHGERDINSLGGLEGLNQGGGSAGSGTTGGGRIISRTLSRNSNQLGRSPGAPRSTQGFWTHQDGTPTGSSWVANITVFYRPGQGSSAGGYPFDFGHIILETPNQYLDFTTDPARFLDPPGTAGVDPLLVRANLDGYYQLSISIGIQQLISIDRQIIADRTNTSYLLYFRDCTVLVQGALAVGGITTSGYTPGTVYSSLVQKYGSDPDR